MLMAIYSIIPVCVTFPLSSYNSQFLTLEFIWHPRKKNYFLWFFMLRRHENFKMNLWLEMRKILLMMMQERAIQLMMTKEGHVKKEMEKGWRLYYWGWWKEKLVKKRGKKWILRIMTKEEHVKKEREKRWKKYCRKGRLVKKEKGTEMKTVLQTMMQGKVSKERDGRETKFKENR